MSTFSSECVPNVIIGASSLHIRIRECGLQYNSAILQVFAVPGLSFKHRNPEKVITNFVKEKIVNHPFAQWHDVVSNSLTAHPSNCNGAATSEEVLERLTLLKAYGMKVIFHRRRSSMEDVEGEKIQCNCPVPYIKFGNLCRQSLGKHQ